MTIRMSALSGALLACLILLFPLSLPAEVLFRDAPEQVTANLGGFEILDDVSAYEMGWELHFPARDFKILPSWMPDLTPTLGVMANTRGSLYPYAGFRADIDLGERWVFSPGAATGIYYREGGKNLGGALEFRTHAEFAYRLANGGRIGLCFYHLSNARLFSFNPGTESLVLTYSARLRR